MPRPKNKTELISSSNENFNKLWDTINSLTEKELHTEFIFSSTLKEAHWQRDKNIRDILIHLYEWHNLILNWINSNNNWVTKSFLPEKYNWKTFGKLNIEFWKKHQQTPYEKSIKILKESHNEVMKLIQTFSDEELFTKKYFSWTGTTSLGSYCISATSSHYDWAIKKIKTLKKKK